jgi:hypothetical protein
MVEFTMLIPIWVPLLLGTMWLGSSMVRGQQINQMARDLASMYSRGIDFAPAGGTASSAMLSQITAQLGTLTASGNGVVIFSRLTYVGKNVCIAAGFVNGDGSANTGACPNYGKFVFTQRYTQGNTSLFSSNYGDPNPADVVSTQDYRIYESYEPNPSQTYVSDTADVSTNFTNWQVLPAPLEQTPNTDGYQSGEPIYVVEVFFQSSALARYTSGGDYAYAIF